MVQMLASKPRQDKLPVIFNVDGVVGAAPAANLANDVILVKAFLRKIGDNPSPGLDAATIKALKAVQVNSNADAALITAIKAYQKSHQKNNPATIVDGRVSPAKEGYLYSANTSWTIVQLNFNMKFKTRFGAVWPCVHLASSCHASLKPIIQDAIFGAAIE